MLRSRSMRPEWLGAAIVVMLFAGFATASFAQNHSVHRVSEGTTAYLGNLNDSNGDPVSDGDYTMGFRLLVNEGDLSELWTETRTVNVKGGRFVVYLGEVSPLTDSTMEAANYIEVTVNGETLSPATKLTRTPSAFTANVSKSLDGDMYTGDGYAFIGKGARSNSPKVVDLRRNLTGGQVTVSGDIGGTWSSQVTLAGGPSGGAMHVLGPDSTEGPLVSSVIDNGSGRVMVGGLGGQLIITGDNGGTWSTQVSMAGGPSGGAMHVLGADSTAGPLASLVVDNGSGMMNLYPGHDWISGPDTAMSMSVGAEGGRLGIWGTNGTGIPQVEMMGTADGSELNFYPGHDWLAGPDQAMQMAVDSAGARLGIWGTNGTGIPQVDLFSTAYAGGMEFYPGHDWLAGPTHALKMSVDTQGGRLGIWGTDGTATPQIEALGTSVGAELNLYPGHDWAAGPTEAMQMKVDSTGARLGIWGTDGTALPQAQLLSTPDGGNLGIWGTDGTGIPQIELMGTSEGAQLKLYPGHDWAAGPTEAMKMAVDSNGARLGIWGTNGTSVEQLQLASTTAGGQLGIWGTEGTGFPQVSARTSTDGGVLSVHGITGSTLEKVEFEAGDGAGNIGIWGTNGTSFPRANLYGDFYGGTLVLRDSTNTSKIFLDGVSDGDGSVNLPASAINATEMLNEPGLAQGKGSSCNNIDTTVMEDLATVTITIPEDGYIFLTGAGMVEFSGTTSGNRVDVQIDETSGGSSTTGRFSRIGLAAYSSTSYSSFDFCVTRTYFKSAGTHTFILEGRKMFIGGTASVCWPVLTAVYLPTSYGTVSTVASNSDWRGDERSSVSEGVYGTEGEVDLRALEIRAEQARAKALEAELELAKARMGVK